jgi:hypothetical protein
MNTMHTVHTVQCNRGMVKPTTEKEFENVWF